MYAILQWLVQVIRSFNGSKMIEFGLGLRVPFPLVQRSPVQLFLANGETIRDVFLDQATGVSFWPTNAGNIYRVNPDTFVVADSAVVNCS
jgi:hypothetical protein